MHSVVFSPDSSLLLVGDYRGRVQMWKTSDWSQKGLLQTQQQGIGTLAISSDGKRLFVGSWFFPGGVSIWDLETENELRKFGFGSSVGFLALSPDDRTLAVGGADHNLVLWDVETGKRLQMIQAHFRSVNGVAFSKDGNRLATADGDAIVRIWDAASKGEIEKDPNTLLAMARLGLLRAEQNRFEDAQALISKVVELSKETQHLSEDQVSDVKNIRVDALESLARLQEGLGHWGEALESRKELVRLDPDEHYYQYQVASAHLFLEDEESFWQIWQKMFDRWGDTESSTSAKNRIVKLRLFVDAPDHELQTAFKYADRAFEKRKGLASFKVFLKGVAEYRRGNFVEALKHFEAAKIGFETGKYLSKCQYFASMAHHQLGDSAAAKAAFLDARNRQQVWESDLRASQNSSWLYWQQAEVVRREAAALLGIDESQPGPPDSDTSK